MSHLRQEPHGRAGGEGRGYAAAARGGGLELPGKHVRGTEHPAPADLQFALREGAAPEGGETYLHRLKQFVRMNNTPGGKRAYNAQKGQQHILSSWWHLTVLRVENCETR